MDKHRDSAPILAYFPRTIFDSQVQQHRLTGRCLLRKAGASFGHHAPGHTVSGSSG